MGTRALAAIAVVLVVLLAGPAQAAVVVRSDARLQLAVGAPIRLAAGEAGETTVNAAATRAWTILDKPSPNIAKTALRVSAPNATHDVHMRVVSHDGLASLPNLIVSIGEAVQASVVGGTLVTSSGAPVEVAQAGSLPVTVLHLKRGGPAATLALEIVATPKASIGSTLVERWTLQIS